MEELNRLIKKSYGSADDVFAGHSSDMENAAKSINAANEADIGFTEFIQLHENYLRTQNCTPEHVQQQIIRVKDISNYFKNK